MSWTLIASGLSVNGGTGSGNSITLNTVGADLIVAVGNGYSDAAPGSVTDNQSNTFSSAVYKNSGQSRAGLQIFYVHNPTTSASHTFTKSLGSNADFVVLAYSGSAASPLDQTNSAVVAPGGKSDQAGSITPSQSNELIIFAVSIDDPALGATPTVNSGFSLLEFGDDVPGSTFGLAVSALAQGSAAAVNPTLTRATTSTLYDVALIASFKAAGVATPKDCSFLFQAQDLRRHPPHLDTNQGQAINPPVVTNPTPSSLGFWSQPPALVQHPAPLPADQRVVVKQDNATPAQTLSWWFQPPTLAPHAPVVDTNQSRLVGQSGATPSSIVSFQMPDLQRHPATIDTRQSFVYIAGQTPSAYFWRQPPDLLNHPATLDTNQPVVVGQSAATPSALGFFTQAPDLHRHPATVDTNQPFVYNPPPLGATPSAYFWTQPQDLLRHAPHLDTNQPTLIGQSAATPSQFGFWTQAPDLLRHAPALDTNQSRLTGQAGATPSSLSFFVQAPDLFNHPRALDTNQPFEYAPPPGSPTPSALWWLQPQDLLRHAPHLDTNQSRLVGQTGATPASLAFYVQPQDLLRHPQTLDTNQPFEFNPPTPGATPSALWWTQAPDLLRHAPHLDTNQPRLVYPVGWTPQNAAFWTQPPDLLRHPATLDTRQQFAFYPPPPAVTPSALWWFEPPMLAPYPIAQPDLGSYVAQTLRFVSGVLAGSSARPAPGAYEYDARGLVNQPARSIPGAGYVARFPVKKWFVRGPAQQKWTATMAISPDLTPPIDPGEQRDANFDFARQMTAGSTITSVVSITCTQTNGTSDATPSARIIGSPAVSASPETGAASQCVTQLVGNMVSGARYRLQCIVATSDGQQPSIIAHVNCALLS